MALYSKDAVGDLVLLQTIDEANILATLKQRFQKDLIYTHIGNVLLSVNPFKQIAGLYSEAKIAAYRGRYIYENPPHVFGLAEDTYRALCTDGEDQCVIISGESGAGKTEASKKILEFIAAVTGSGAEIDRVKTQMLKSNPLLESFGNARTQRNNNSSRFGKYMEIFFDARGDPCGGKITNFLLEKSRVVGQLPDERSFHIFYMMLDGCNATQKQQLQLLPHASAYSYLNKNQCYTVDRMNDAEEWRECREAMTAMNMTDREVDEILRILSAVLWIGQLEFAPDGADKSKVVDSKPIEVVASLLGCDAKLLAQGMSARTFVANNSSVLTPLNADQAKYTRDAFAKAVYFRLFDYVVSRINEAIKAGPESQQPVSTKKKIKSVRTIGVLDIYGFEIFENNSFEQFCINFVNEKLQQIFIEKTIKQEQEEYMREGIAWTPIDYFNNKIVCDLIESKKPAGIIAFLDEECLLGKGTDATFLDKLDSNLKTHKHFARAAERGKPDDCFTVKHYAGDVKYCVTNFIDKNKDLVWKDLLLIGESSSNSVMTHATMFPKGAAANLGLARPITAGTNFKNQVQALMDTLSKCQPHYIRCIKPNDVKKAGVFNDEMTLHQIRYLGLLENVRVRRAGFAFRMTFERFLHRYKMLSPATWPNPAPEMSAQDGCKAITDTQKLVEGAQYQMGKTKIFIREPTNLFSLEEMRERKLHQLATLIQTTYRAYRARKYFKELRQRSLGLFGTSKVRRRGSVNRKFFLGDYLNLATNPVVTKMMAKYGDKSVLFADECDKVNRKMKTQRRNLLLTNNAVYNLGEVKFKENRRIALKAITGVSVSPYADNWIVIHVKSEYDYVMQLERKTEFITALTDAFKAVMNDAPLPLAFVPEINIATKEKKTQKVSFVKNESQESVTHAPDLNNKDRLIVTVGRIDVVNDAYLKGLEIVPMKRTDPSLKPKPGYLGRPGAQGGTAVRGISISGGQGQKATNFQQQQQQQQQQPQQPEQPVASSSSVPARPAPAVRPVELWATAVEDFVGQDARELALTKGDVIRILSNDDPSGWWSAEKDGKLGYAPSTYLELLPGPPHGHERRPSMHNAPLPGRK